MKARLPLALAVLAALSMACSLLVNFDPEGQPCGAQGDCLMGYGCVDKKCVQDAPDFRCDQCASGGCLPGKNECLPNTCEYKVCPPAYYCDDQSGPPTCKLIPAGQLGAQCQSEADCTVTQEDVCLLGAIPSNTTGQLRGGICAERCGLNDSCPTDSTCRTFSMAKDAGVTKVCLTNRTVTECTNDEDCARGGLVCTVFDHPQLGALTACDKPLPVDARAEIGEACVSIREVDGGGEFCGNGLCIPELPPGTTRPATCGELCEQGSCSSGEVCERVQYAVVPTSIRYVPMCIPAITRCAQCAANPSVCGADAPTCTNLNSDFRCLGQCTPDAGVNELCPSGFTCGPVSDAGYRCIPIPGFCP